MGRKSKSRQTKKKENQWSRVDLPSPPQFNGMNFAMWTSRMRVYLRYVDTHVELNDEAKDTLALHLIQLAVDERLMQMITAAKTSKEAWCILEEECSERGSSHKETAVVMVQVEAEKKLEVSVSQIEHNKFEMTESHIAVKHVDVVEVEEEAAIVAAENGELATQEVAGQPVEAEKEAEAVGRIEEDELMKSMPMRAEIFPNSLDVCECAGIESKNLPAIAEEKEHAVNVPRNFDEDLKFIEEWLEKPNYVELNCTEVVAVRSLAEGSIEVAKMNEKEGSHVAAKDEEKGDSFATAVEPAENEEMDEQDEGCEDEKLVEEIFEKWSPEEIRYYYELMWQQATDSQVAGNMKSEDSMWEHHMMKATLNFIEGEESWQNAIGKFNDIDGRMRPKELEEIRKKKVRKKKKTRRIVEYKVWSKRKKKAGEGKTNFDLFCDCM